MNSTLLVCGRLGLGDDDRVKAMATLLGDWSGDVRPVLQRANAVVWGTGACVRGPGGITAWSPAPLPTDLADTIPSDPAVARRTITTKYDACLLTPDDAVLQTGISGAAPLYVDDGASQTSPTAHFCSSVEPLARTRDAPLRPDWDAWAHIIAAGGPLEGRTTFAGIRRLPPWTRFAPGAIAPDGPESDWPWLGVRSTYAAARVDEVRDALTDAVAAAAEHGPVASLLSGGWDSRVLATLAMRATTVTGPSSEPPTGWTTSSDSGHVLEELVAHQVAGRLGMRHEIVSPRWDEFAADLAHFAEAVDFQTSFHVWLVPLARALAGHGATVLDGLGGGIFVGGACPDTHHTGSPIDHRFDRLTHYLAAASDVLHPAVTAQIRERTRESFAAVARPLADHPFAATFTAYLTRTLPGISLAPMGLMARATPAATPFLSDRVVRAALAIPADRHTDGRLYPELLRPLNRDLADLPTAADLAPRHRRHRRRVSSVEAAHRIRELLLREPIRPLLATELATADLDRWCTLLDRTRSQHLLRGLATLSLWVERYDGILADTSPDALLEAVA